jgi:hypothetical protein
MKSIRARGMAFKFEGLNTPCGTLHTGQTPDGVAASLWSPTSTERTAIANGQNILLVFPRGGHTKDAYLKISVQQEDLTPPSGVIEIPL